MSQDPRVRCALISGASASGKDHLCDLLEQKVKELSASTSKNGKVSFIHLCCDSFYKELSPAEKTLAEKDEYNFDEPRAIDSDMLIECCNKLADFNNDYVDVPIYCFKTHSRIGNNRIVLDKNDARRVIVVQGIFVLCFEELRKKWSNLNIFLQTDPDVVALRRVMRDTLERGRDVAGVMHQFFKTVKPGYHQHVEPAAKFADLSFPYNIVNAVLVETIALQLLHGTSKRSD